MVPGPNAPNVFIMGPVYSHFHPTPTTFPEMAELETESESIMNMTDTDIETVDQAIEEAFFGASDTLEPEASNDFGMLTPYDVEQILNDEKEVPKCRNCQLRNDFPIGFHNKTLSLAALNAYFYRQEEYCMTHVRTCKILRRLIKLRRIEEDLAKNPIDLDNLYTKVEAFLRRIYRYRSEVYENSKWDSLFVLPLFVRKLLANHFKLVWRAFSVYIELLIQRVKIHRDRELGEKVEYLSEIYYGFDALRDIVSPGDREVRQKRESLATVYFCGRHCLPEEHICHIVEKETILGALYYKNFHKV